MKLYNHTKVPDQILKDVLYHAAKLVGSVRTSNVVVLVKMGKGGGCVKDSIPYKGYLTNKKYPSEGYKKLVKTDGGWMKIFLLRHKYRNRTYDPQANTHVTADELGIAENFFSTAAHEWQHIKDFQKGKSFGQYNRNWKNRPHEKRAIVAASRAVRNIPKRKGCEDSILDLATTLEDLERNKQ